MFTTVNSLNSVNIVGRYTNDLCMLPIQPFYRLPIFFCVKKERKPRMLFVESILLFQVDFGYANNLISHFNSYPFLNF